MSIFARYAQSLDALLDAMVAAQGANFSMAGVTLGKAAA